MQSISNLLKVALLIVLAGCSSGGSISQPPAPTSVSQPTTAQAQLDVPLSLHIGETANVGDVSLTFTGIADDSRCPSRVTCVWAGAAEALIKVGVAGQASEETDLVIHGQNQESVQSHTQVGGYTIRLIALDPYPVDPEPIPAEQYVATFVVMEGNLGYTVVSDGSIEGVIVPEQDARGLDPQAQGYWTPVESDVRAFEAGLVAFLQEAAPAASPDLWQKQQTYKRQYAGLIREGRRLIYASFFCDTMGEEWRRSPLFVADGGDCFFQLSYDAERKTYADLMINGES